MPRGGCPPLGGGRGRLLLNVGHASGKQKINVGWTFRSTNGGAKAPPYITTEEKVESGLVTARLSRPFPTTHQRKACAVLSPFGGGSGEVVPRGLGEGSLKKCPGVVVPLWRGQGEVTFSSAFTTSVASRHLRRRRT